MQERALAPSNTQKLVLSTNIAETSVTIDGVTVVIDSGLAKLARTDAGTGALELRTQEISQASAVQRAGRAGRTRPGACVRLYSEDAFHRRPLRDVPEILRSDLSRLALDLARCLLRRTGRGRTQRLLQRKDAALGGTMCLEWVRWLL